MLQKLTLISLMDLTQKYLVDDSSYLIKYVKND